MKIAAIAAGLLLMLGSTGLARADENSLLTNSPFSPAGASGQTGSTGSRLDQLEFSGVNVVGKQIYVSVIDKTTGKGAWMLLKTQGQEGLVVEYYDSKKDEIVVSLGGQTKTLSLRMAKVTVGSLPPGGIAAPAVAAAPGPVVVAPAPGAAPTAPAKDVPAKAPEVEAKEREARMLVSDLLEIGMIQRKAYEEKKAAEEAAKKKSAN